MLTLGFAVSSLADLFFLIELHHVFYHRAFFHGPESKVFVQEMTH